MEISVDPLQCLIALLSFVAFAAIIAAINGVIRLISRIIQGPERIDAVVVVSQSDTIHKYAPQALSTTADGRTSLDLQVLIAKLFSQAVDDETARRWTKSGKVSLLLVTDPIDNAQFAAELAVGALMKKGLAIGTSSESKVYSVPSVRTEKAQMAYLVIVGNIPKPPPQIRITLGAG